MIYFQVLITNNKIVLKLITLLPSSKKIFTVSTYITNGHYTQLKLTCKILTNIMFCGNYFKTTERNFAEALQLMRHNIHSFDNTLRL